MAACAPVALVPPAASAPDQPPAAEHAVAFDELQVSVDMPPVAVTEGLAVNVAVGMTLTTVATVGLVPPAPTQLSEKEELVATGPVLLVPLTAKGPVQLPEAVHPVALSEFQVNVDAPPAATTLGLVVNVAVGTGAEVTGPTTVTTVDAVAADPFEAVQTTVKVVLAARAPLLLVPLLAKAPVHPPEALHAVAPVELQVKTVELPLLTDDVAALSVALGAGALVVGGVVVGGAAVPAVAEVDDAAAVVFTPFPQPVSAKAANKLAIDVENLNEAL